MKKLIGLIIIAAAIAASYFYYVAQETKSAPKQARPMANVVYVEVTQQQIADDVEALGTIKANEFVVITPKVTDKITAIRFQDGEMVGQKQVLVTQQNAQQLAQLSAAEIKLKEHQRESARIKNLVSNQSVAELERDRLHTLIEIAKADLAEAQAALNDRIIMAPFAGRLGLRQVSPGSLVTPGTVITTLDDIATVKLDFSVPERFLQRITIGDTVEAYSASYPERVFLGKLTSIDSRINPSTRAIIMRATFDNPHLELLPGMLMKVQLIQNQRQALVLPESAIIPKQQQHFVYVLDGENKVVERLIKIGSRKRGLVEIVAGINVGDKVVTRGILKVRAGQQVAAALSENFGQSSATKVVN